MGGFHGGHSSRSSRGFHGGHSSSRNGGFHGGRSSSSGSSSRSSYSHSSNSNHTYSSGNSININDKNDYSYKTYKSEGSTVSSCEDSNAVVMISSILAGIFVSFWLCITLNPIIIGMGVFAFILCVSIGIYICFKNTKERHLIENDIYEHFTFNENEDINLQKEKYENIKYNYLVTLKKPFKNKLKSKIFFFSGLFIILLAFLSLILFVPSKVSAKLINIDNTKETTTYEFEYTKDNKTYKGIYEGVFKDSFIKGEDAKLNISYPVYVTRINKNNVSFKKPNTYIILFYSISIVGWSISLVGLIIRKSFLLSVEVVGDLNNDFKIDEKDLLIYLNKDKDSSVLKYCPSCGKELQSNELLCDSCNSNKEETKKPEEINEEAKKQEERKKYLIKESKTHESKKIITTIKIIGFLFLFLGILFIFLLKPNSVNAKVTRVTTVQMKDDSYEKYEFSYKFMGTMYIGQGDDDLAYDSDNNPYYSINVGEEYTVYVSILTPNNYHFTQPFAYLIIVIILFGISLGVLLLGYALKKEYLKDIFSVGDLNNDFKIDEKDLDLFREKIEKEEMERLKNLSCPYCNNIFKEGYSYCPYCGNKIKE